MLASAQLSPRQYEIGYNKDSFAELEQEEQVIDLDISRQEIDEW